MLPCPTVQEQDQDPPYHIGALTHVIHPRQALQQGGRPLNSPYTILPQNLK